MKRLVRVAVWLYPSWWRQRYAREFEALLEDVKPGWWELFDVLNGAVTMQIKTLGTLPVVCALAGAIAGGIIALRTPEVFASSATIYLKGRDTANPGPGATQDFRVSVDRAVGASLGRKEAISVTLLKGDSADTTLKVSYLDRDPAQAQRAAEQLTAAIAKEHTERGVATEVIEAPSLPTVAIRPDYPTTVASGGGIGLVAGGIVLLFLRARRRPESRTAA